MIIDAYAHIVPEGHLRRVEALLDAFKPSDRVAMYDLWLRGSDSTALTNLDDRWRTMDALGEESRQVLVTGIYPMEELGSPTTSAELASAVNDEMAELVSRHPDRFAGFAADLPLNDLDASVEELERSVTQLGAVGAQVHTHVSGRPLDHPDFEVLFERMHSLDKTVWLHPTRSHSWSDYPAEDYSKYGIWWSLGWPYETGVAMTRLVYSGHLERYPGLKILTHHMGGVIPHLSGRLDEIQADDQTEAWEHVFKRPIMDYYRMFYSDTAMFGAPHAVRCSMDFFGPENVLFGTDMPLGGPTVLPDTLSDIKSLGLSDDNLQKVLNKNAQRVLGVS